jgi:NAD(P)-dependent dehydrogenase (short-subunit alcohol dehydrogenase family)
MKKAIFITGAAAGIGAATAELFLKKGWRVGLYDIQPQAMSTLTSQYDHQQIRTGVLDVTDAQGWKNALEDFCAWSGHLDVLLNNAGILFSGPFEQTALDQHAKTFAVNVQGIINGCHSALPYLKQTAQSRVINMSSASAIYGQADLVSYSSSKFAIRGLTEALDIEWQKYGIRVLDVMPLFVQTGMVTNMNASSFQRLGVSLTADDVAKVIYQAATASHRLAKTHWTVGLSTKASFALSGLVPSRLNKLINQWISH